MDSAASHPPADAGLVLLSFLETLRETGAGALEMPRYPLGKGFECLEKLEAAARTEGRLLGMLHDWHRIDSLEAGSPTFDEEAAWWGARMFLRVAWLYLDRAASEEDSAALLKEDMPRKDTAEAHFSADLTLHWLPDLFKQAQAASPEDPLLGHIRLLAARAPLSGMGISWPNPSIPDALRAHPGIWRLLIDRVIASRDREKLSDPAIAEAVRTALGSFADVLAKGLLDPVPIPNSVPQPTILERGSDR